MPRWTRRARSESTRRASRGGTQRRLTILVSIFQETNNTRTEDRSQESRWLHIFSHLCLSMLLYRALTYLYLGTPLTQASPTSHFSAPILADATLRPVQSQLTPHTRSSCCFTSSRIRCATESRIGSPTRERRSRIWRRGCTVVTACHGGSACGRCRPRLCARFDRLRLPPGRGSQVPDHASKRLRFLGSAHPVSADGEEDAKNEYKRKDTAATHSALGHHVATVLVCRCVRPWT